MLIVHSQRQPPERWPPDAPSPPTEATGRPPDDHDMSERLSIVEREIRRLRRQLDGVMARIKADAIAPLDSWDNGGGD